ncbi:hypothetical protein DFR41_108116 [Pseudacidovorax intermedius]|uniref:Uncharacterized protein n=1 Tax=Pseudacidovorax intermedius TaxID=433924 RepID=A0A370FDW9_9BURK|nr:hypothetical protein [Pseudacidovorax intermedius]RDI21992.1 hypothetical protein DFR41_108116 [Pseudacidovorax intermedius]
MSNSQNSRPGHTEHNAPGKQPATPRNEGRRTPESRHDREDHAGSSKQKQQRQGRGIH